METLLFYLRQKLSDAIASAFAGQIASDDAKAAVTICMQPDLGDYQCNSAMPLARLLRRSPREIAEKIIEGLPPDPIIEKCSVAGAGFINIRISASELSRQLDLIFQDAKLGAALPAYPQKVIVEFSSPNIAKELHVGHLRSTIIGDSIARLFEFLGHDVLRLNHVGDWGTQFGMLIAYLKKNEPAILSGKAKADLTTLTHWYKEAKKAFDADEAFKKTAQDEVVRLQGGDAASLLAWRAICDISRAAFKEIYALMDINIIERGESFYNPMLSGIIDDLTKKGLIEISGGAKCIFLPGFINREGQPLPIIIQKSDGGFNYDTTELAGFRQRVKEEKAERIIIVTDAGQSLHFQMIHAAAIKAGYIDPAKVRFDHVTFGVVLGPDGKKFKTRSGETEKLIDLLLEAVSRARALLVERMSMPDEKELAGLSLSLGIGAIKYADLSGARQKDYVFSYERMLKFEGNTAAFLLYAFVRIMGIKRKVRGELDELLGNTKFNLRHPSEIALGLHLRRFGEVLLTFEEDLMPNHLADYLYELAEKFNAFFRDCRVEGVKEQNERLLLCELCARILKKGLNILGLRTVNRM